MILASGSPRRKEILSKYVKNLEIISPEVEEISDKENIIDKIKEISYKKAKEVSIKNKDCTVLAADTVVIYNNEMILKPENRENAKEILNVLSGQTHKVITGYTIINENNNIEIIDYEETKVTFEKILDEDLEWYLDQNTWKDKSGAYGIQDEAAIFIKNVEGDFLNVMGLPIKKVINAFKNLGYSLIEIENLK